MKQIIPMLVLASTALGACTTTVPSFDFAKSHRDSSGSAPNPTVTQIRDHIYCELKRAGVPSQTAITVALTLQVDDTFDVTPSFSYTQLLHAPRVSVVSTLGADYGRARKRLFTATYTINSTEMEKKVLGAPACTTPFDQRAMDLRGDLGIAEIVANGRATSEQPAPPETIPGLLVAPDLNQKLGPTYGSQVQFVITRQIGSFGPVWTLHHWKAGGGSSGLINGKRLDTDSVVLTFAAAAPPKLPDPKIQKDAAAAHADAAAATEDANTKRATATKTAAGAELLSAPRNFAGLKSSALQAAQQRADQARSEAAAASVSAELAEARAQLAAERDRFLGDIAAADRARADRSQADNLSAAGLASREQLTTILLQNLAPNR